MAKSLILVLTPYEMEVVGRALTVALNAMTMKGITVKEERAMTRVQDKVEQMLSETSKVRS